MVTGIVLVLTLVGSSASLNVHTIAVFTGTPVALFAGLTAATDGRVVSAVPLAPVVKLLVKAAAALPARSVTSPRLTVCRVLVANGLAGVNVSVRRSVLNATLPASGPSLPVTTTAPAPTDTALSGSLKASTTGAFTATPPAPSGGLTPTTAGPVVSVSVPVVKLANELTACPARSVAWLNCR